MNPLITAIKRELKLSGATALIQLGLPSKLAFRLFRLTKSQQWIAMQRAGVTKRLRWKILKRDNYTCYLCNRRIEYGTKWHLEHKRPLSLGGDNRESNLGASHALCNLKKGAKPLAV